MKTCFECGKIATENHHIIPKSMGGNKTIPLCTFCHAKVHNLHNTGRTDFSSELVKEGQDKLRIWDLFVVYQVINDYEATDYEEIKGVILEVFNIEFSKNKIINLKRRLDEVEHNYLSNLFDIYVGKDLSNFWNRDGDILKSEITVSVISKYINKYKVNSSNVITPKIVKKLSIEIKDRFLLAVSKT